MAGMRTGHGGRRGGVGGGEGREDVEQQRWRQNHRKQPHFEKGKGERK